MLTRSIARETNLPESNDQELTNWVNAYTKEMLSWAVRRTSNATVAEDLVQETFLVAAERIGSFRRDSHPRTWLFGILNNKIREYYREKSRLPISASETEDPVSGFFADEGHWKRESAPAPWNDDDDEHLLKNEEFVKIFEACLAELPSEWHTCLTAKFIHNRRADEICQELGISTTNYWQIIHRAKLKMRACLENHWFKKNK